MDNNNLDFDFDDIDLDEPGDSSGNGMDYDFDDGGGTDVNNQDNTSNDYFSDSSDDDMTENEAPLQSKKYIIIIACGVVLTLLILFIGSRVLGKKKQSDEALANLNNQQTITTNENTNVNVDNIMNNGSNNIKQSNTAQQDVSITYHKDENSFSWMEITDSENIVFEENYVERIFTVTTVKHYARTVDSASNLVVKSTLSGSISGLPGTYTLEVPYSKGVLLKTGNSFTVNVLLGTYNNKIVVGDITY